jgi:hypothetical protein
MTDTTDRTPTASERRGLTGWRRKTDTVYTYLSGLFFAGVLLQVFLAGVGVFGINNLKVANASSFNAHRAWGFILMLTSLVLLIVALAAWQSARTMISAFVLALLTVIAQNVLAALGDSNKWVGGLHALDGMFILLLSLWIAVTGWRRVHSR